MENKKIGENNSKSAIFFGLIVARRWSAKEIITEILSNTS